MFADLLKYQKITMNTLRIGLVSISDRASSGVYQDKGIPALEEWLARALTTPFELQTRLIPDEQAIIEQTLCELVDEMGCHLVRNLEKAAMIAAAADVPVNMVSRYDLNIASGIIHTIKEYEATDVVIGLHRKANIVDTFFGNLAESLLKGNMAADVVQVMEFLHVPRAVILGFSDGANVALETASCYPGRVSAVVAVSGNALPRGMSAASLMEVKLKYALWRGLEKVPLPRGVRERAVKSRQLLGLMARWPRLDKEKLSCIQAPVLILTGRMEGVFLLLRE